jgi:hypothetical protein
MRVEMQEENNLTTLFNNIAQYTKALEVDVTISSMLKNHPTTDQRRSLIKQNIESLRAQIDIIEKLAEVNSSLAQDQESEQRQVVE